tara:strand:+ start:236 stop:643 length:408 start_codon:yes stop_codon:yes gene_type:complete
MGNGSSALKINFEDVQNAIKKNDIAIISTLPLNKQECLLHKTLTPADETHKLNEWMKSPLSAPLIIIYGENSADNAVGKKYMQLVQLGFKRIAIYAGGIFEWLLLQDIYGDELFPTTGVAQDMLKFKGSSKKNML